jgi:hypothetical protein
MPQLQTAAIKTVVPIAGVVGDSLTSLHGLIYAVEESGYYDESGYSVTITRKVDYLAPQFTAALASGQLFPFVKILTKSGHVLSFLDGQVTGVTKAGHRVGPGLPIVAVGMEAITWGGAGQVAVDYVYQPSSYNWLGLNS